MYVLVYVLEFVFVVKTVLLVENVVVFCSTLVFKDLGILGRFKKEATCSCLVKRMVTSLRMFIYIHLVTGGTHT